MTQAAITPASTHSSLADSRTIQGSLSPAELTPEYRRDRSFLIDTLGRVDMRESDMDASELAPVYQPQD